MTIGQAKVFDQKQNAKLARTYSVSAKASGYTYRNVSFQYSYTKNSAYKACLEAQLKLSGSTIYYQINGASVWTRIAPGSTTATWQQAMAKANGSFPSTSVTLSGSGYFQVQTSSSVGASGGVPGFSVSGSTGSTTTWTSQTLNMTKTYSLY